MATTTISVLANPAHACDHTGAPMAAVQYYNSGGQQWVGAQLDHVASAKAKRTLFTFPGVPVELRVADPMAAAYYRRRLQSGELLAADDATAAWAGVPAVQKPVRAQTKKTTAKAFPADA